MLHVITRLPSRRMAIDHGRALHQHAHYRAAIEKCGAQVHVLEADDASPDCAFIDAMAVILTDLAFLTMPGARSRRSELNAVERVLPEDRVYVSIKLPATVDGGDVLVIGRHVFVGRSTRTNEEGIWALMAFLKPFGYQVSTVDVPGAPHLKTACTALNSDTVLINRRWVDASAFDAFNCIDVAESEPFAANTLRVGEHTLVQTAFPATTDILLRHGFNVTPIDISEFAKAEAGLTSLSLLYETSPSRPKRELANASPQPRRLTLVPGSTRHNSVRPDGHH